MMLSFVPSEPDAGSRSMTYAVAYMASSSLLTVGMCTGISRVAAPRELSTATYVLVVLFGGIVAPNVLFYVIYSQLRAGNRGMGAAFVLVLVVYVAALYGGSELAATRLRPESM